MINITDWISSNMIKDIVGNYIADNIDIASILEDLTLEILDDYSDTIEDAIDQYIEENKEEIKDQIQKEIIEGVADFFG